MKRSNRSMIQGPLFSSIVLYTIPIILTSVLQLLFNAADLVIVGRFCGSVSVAAVGATGAITNLIVNLFIGLSVGTGVTVAHALGSREDEAVHRAVHTAMPTALIGGAILTVVGILLSEPLLRMMATPETVLPLSTIYMQIYFSGMVFNMVYNFCASILRAAGDTKSPLIFLTLAGVINVLLNVVFVTVLHMNVAGVALATTVSQGVSAVLVVIALMRRTDACHLDLKKMKIYKPQFMKMVNIGIPAGIQGSLFSISNVLIQSSVNSFGDVFMSGNAAAGNIEGFIYVAMNAFHHAALTFTSQNLGAHNLARIKRVAVQCVLIVTIVGIAIGGGAMLAAEPLLSIYDSDPEVIAFGVLRMQIICLTYFGCGIMDVMGGLMRGLGYSITPMIVSLVGACGFRIFWIYTFFAWNPTLTCLYTSYPISWALTAAAHAVCFIIAMRQMKRKLMPAQ